MEVELTGPKQDLHSGSFGGAVANPVNVLAEMISKLHNKNGRITIPHFYNGVNKITKKEKNNYKRLKFSDRKLVQELGVNELSGEKGFTTLERIWARPTLDCNGIFGGFTGKGAKTIVPSMATAKISMRLVPNQDPKRISKEFTKYIKKLAPKSVKVIVRDLHCAYPVLTPLNDKATIAASKAMEKARKAVRTVEITKAIRTTKIGDMRIRKNQAIGLLDTDLVAVANTAQDVLNKVLDEIDMTEFEVVTIYFGQDVEKADADKVAATIGEKYPNLQIEVVKGGQPHYLYIISIE